MSFTGPWGGPGGPPGAATSGRGKRHPKHEDEELGKLFVGGLSWETTQETLLRYFSRFGEVIDCVVMKNAETSRSRGFGFVTFSDPNNIECVIQSSPHNLDGRTIDPKPCDPRSMQKPKKNTNWPKIFLGGLPSSITETDLRSFFSRYGEVTEVVIMYDQEKKKSRGFGFLSFGDDTSVDKAVVEHYVNIQNKQVEIKRAEPRSNVPMDMSNGPIVDQWGAPPAPQNGINTGAPAAPAAPAYSGWGAPPAQIPTVPPTGHHYAPQPEYSSPPNHWGAPPPAQPTPPHHTPQHHTGWGAPPGPPAQTTYTAAPVQQPPQYVSPSTYAPPPPQQQHQTYGTSYWGSPPGPTPPPTPVDPYTQHPPPQSPPQPDYSYSRVYTSKPPQAAPIPTQVNYGSPPTSTDYYYRPPHPTQEHPFIQIPDPNQGTQRRGTYPPPPAQIPSYHPYRRT